VRQLRISEEKGRKKKTKKPQDESIMACPLLYMGGHKKLLSSVFTELSNDVVNIHFVLLWPPCGIGQAIIFSSCGFFLFFLLLFFLA